MEIERKWMVKGWPEGLAMTEDYRWTGLHQRAAHGAHPREALAGGPTALVLCFKGGGTLSREEIETEIDAGLFAKLEHLIGKPLIHKERRGYLCPGGLTLEVNCVDPDLPTAFWYAEVEFASEAQALAWDPASAGLGAYLSDECTGKPGSSMGEYWVETPGPDRLFVNCKIVAPAFTNDDKTATIELPTCRHDPGVPCRPVRINQEKRNCQ